MELEEEEEEEKDVRRFKMQIFSLNGRKKLT